MVPGDGGATRYALPCRPVNPLLIIEVMGIRSARHFWHRRCEVVEEWRKDVGCVGGELDGEAVEAVEFEMVELRRRRKGTDWKR
jgi:hypothetical protein